jgi:type I restriction enzyme S subunit
MKFVRIKDIMSVNRGASPRPISNTAYFSETGTYGWVRISDVTKSDKHLFNTEERLSDLGASFSVKLDKPTLFLSIAGSVGKACINKRPVCIHDGFVYFSSIKNYDINYLFWFFSNSIIYEGLGKKGVFLNLNIDTIKNILIPKLKIEEQLKISKFLDTQCSKIDTEVSLLQKKSILLDEYKNALIYETVTKGLDKNAEMKDSGVEWIGETPNHWKIKRIKEIANVEKGKSTEMFDFDQKNNNLLPCIDTNFLRNRENSIMYNASGRLTNKGDVLILWDGANAGELFINTQKGYLGSTFGRFNNKKSVNSNFLFYYLKGIEKHFRNNLVGMGIPHVNTTKLKTTAFFHPPYEEQLEIVKFLNDQTKKIEKQIDLINKKVELLKEYKQSLIYEAVTGQLEIE